MRYLILCALALSACSIDPNRPVRPGPVLHPLYLPSGNQPGPTRAMNCYPTGGGGMTCY